MSIRLTNPRWWGIALIAVLITACGQGSESWPGISSSDDNETIFVSYKRTVVSVDADNDRNWVYNGENDANFYAPPVLVDDTVYVGDFKGRVHAINAENGNRRWMYEPERTQVLIFAFGRNDRVLSPITIGDNVLYSGDEYGVFALDLLEAEPSVLWEFETDHGVWSQPLYLSQNSVENEHCSSINADWEIDWGIEDTLLVTSLDQHLYAINPDNGDERWSIDLEGGVAGNLTLDCLRQRIYVGTMNKQVLAIDIKEGEIVARYDTEGWVWGSPVIYETGDDETPYLLYFSDLAGYVYEVPLTSDGFGDRTFRRRVSDDPLRATPLIVEDFEGAPVLVIGGEDRRVYAINLASTSGGRSGVADTSQDFRWVREIDGKALANLVWVDRPREDGSLERLVITGTDKDNQMVVALSLNDGGRVSWSVEYDN